MKYIQWFEAKWNLKTRNEELTWKCLRLRRHCHTPKLHPTFFIHHLRKWNYELLSGINGVPCKSISFLDCINRNLKSHQHYHQNALFFPLIHFPFSSESITHMKLVKKIRIRTSYFLDRPQSVSPFTISTVLPDDAPAFGSKQLLDFYSVWKRRTYMTPDQGEVTNENLGLGEVYVRMYGCTLAMIGSGGSGDEISGIGRVDSLTNGVVWFLSLLKGFRVLRMLTAMPENTTNPAVLATDKSLSLPELSSPLPEAASGFDMEASSTTERVWYFLSGFGIWDSDKKLRVVIWFLSRGFLNCSLRVSSRVHRSLSRAPVTGRENHLNSSQNESFKAGCLFFFSPIFRYSNFLLLSYKCIY